MKEIIFCFVFLPFTVFGSIGRVGMSKAALEKIFNLNDFEHCVSNGNTASAVTLEKLMLSGERPTVWNETTNFVGKCAAEFSYLTSLSKLSETNRSNLLTLSNLSVNRLKKWMQENTLTEEALLAVLPERQRQRADVVGLSRKAETGRKLLDQQESVILQSLTSNRVVYDAEFHSKVKNFIQFIGFVEDQQIDLNNDFVIGPTALNTAIFLADLIVNYYQMSGVVEHVDQYKVVEISSTLGQSYLDTSNQIRTAQDSPFDDRKYFKEVSILTGWELLRRAHTKDRVRLLVEHQHSGLETVIESGLRLINNRNIDNINFLMVVALALIF